MLIVYRLVRVNEDGSLTRIGDFSSMCFVEDYIAKHPGKYEIYDWDCS